jgi:hypothetical protein
MMVYRDMTFCKPPLKCLNTFCDMRLTLNVESRALAADLPVSVADRSEGCMHYRPDHGHLQVGWGHPTLSEDDAK